MTTCELITLILSSMIHMIQSQNNVHIIIIIMIIFRLQVTHDAGKSAEDPAGRGPDGACGGCPHPPGHNSHQQVDVTVDIFHAFIVLSSYVLSSSL